VSAEADQSYSLCPLSERCWSLLQVVLFPTRELVSNRESNTVPFSHPL